MKEAERILQWCVHRRTTLSFDAPGPPALVETVGGNNAMTAGPVGAPQVEIGTCIGSRCGQWRWDSALEVLVVVPGGRFEWLRGDDGELWRVEPLPRPPGVDAQYLWRPRLGQWSKTVVPAAGQRDGHCGLSGAWLFD